MLIGCGILVGAMAGGGGVTTTYLSQNLSVNATTVYVDSTTDFLSEDYVIIGSEKIFYTNKSSTTFTGATRGYADSTARSHLAGAMVYTATSSAINDAMGFNIVAVQDELGWLAIIAVPIMFFVRTIPNIFQMSTNLLTGDLAIISWFLYAMSAGFLITLALVLRPSGRVR